jgi:hypothetical protein
VAVLNHNRPAFYTVSPELMAQMAELCDERQLATLVRKRSIWHTGPVKLRGDRSALTASR